MREPDTALLVGKRAKSREAQYSIKPVVCLRMAFLTGSQCSNWGSLALHPDFFFSLGTLLQEETQEQCECEVADEPVVVRKFRPEKAGNSLEGKTETTVIGGVTGL